MINRLSQFLLHQLKIRCNLNNSLKSRTAALRSKSNIVIPPANTGKDNNNKTAVTITAQPNNGTLWSTWPGIRIFITVVIKFIATFKFIKNFSFLFNS